MKSVKSKNRIKNLTWSAMFLAIGLVLPFFTGQIPQIGSMLLPMHLPVLICGMVCGGGWGCLIGFVLPLLRYALFGMPIIFPMGISMAFELAVYGLIAGMLYRYWAKNTFKSIYVSMIPAMLAGRIVWGTVFALLCGAAQMEFTFKLFWIKAFVEAVPGIILQLVIVPLVVHALGRRAE